MTYRVELESVEELRRFIEAQGAGASLDGAVVQGLDLVECDVLLAGVALSGGVLLGCTLTRGTLARAYNEGALVFPNIPDLPFHPYRPRLYTPEDLYEGYDPARPSTYAQTPDARIYEHWLAAGGSTSPAILESLARRIHDHAMSDAVDGFLEGDLNDGQPERVVAIMGGHGMGRDEASYADVARIGRALTRRGYLAATGGGPGAMEAGHLGAWFAQRDDADLEEALVMLAAAPLYTDARWLAAAFEVRQRFPLTEPVKSRSLGIPTWHYGHEPPNPFATHIAKFFENSIREDGLLSIARNGVIFSPGSAGTIQEIFQDACQNHYSSFGVSPMVFLNRGYWTVEKPVYPLLERLARGRDYSAWISITDDGAEAVEMIETFAREQQTTSTPD